MCLNISIKYSNAPKPFSKQSGLGLPSALFLILVMVLIVAAINQLNEMNALAYGREWLSMRAFYAAESGAQTAAVYVLNPAQALPICDAAFISALNLSASGLSGCNVSVACGLQTVAGDNFYTLTSTGVCGSGADQATRVIQVRLQQ